MQFQPKSWVKVGPTCPVHPPASNVNASVKVTSADGIQVLQLATASAVQAEPPGRRSTADDGLVRHY
jgi:hypothetical protein